MARPLLRALACAALLSAIASSAIAHSALVSATPGPGDRVVGSPTELVARFSQDLDPSKTSLELRDASGASIVRGGEAGEGPREFRLALPELAPGEYEVRWTSYSTEDNEIGRDSYTFEVVAAPSPSPSISATPPPSAPPSVAPSASPSPSPSPQATSASPEPSSGQGGPGSGMDASVLIPIVVALGAVGVLGLRMFRRPRL